MDLPETTRELQNWWDRTKAREAAGTATQREMERDRAMKPGQVGVRGENQEPSPANGRPVLTLLDGTSSARPRGRTHRPFRLELVTVDGARL